MVARQSYCHKKSVLFVGLTGRMDESELNKGKIGLLTSSIRMGMILLDGEERSCKTIIVSRF